MRYPLCPYCDFEIEIDDLDVDRGELIGCPECGITLQVTRVAPIVLDLAPEEEAETWEEL